VAPPKGPAFFPVLKDLVTDGYVTSTPGATKAVRYDPIPGAHHGGVPLAQIGRASASRSIPIICCAAYFFRATLGSSQAQNSRIPISQNRPLLKCKVRARHLGFSRPSTVVR